MATDDLAPFGMFDYRLRTAIIIEVLFDSEPSRVANPHFVTFLVMRNRRQTTMALQCDGVTWFGKGDKGCLRRTDIHSIVVVSSPASATVFFLRRDPETAPEWMKRYRGTWDDVGDKSSGYKICLSDVQPPEERQPAEPPVDMPSRADLVVHEVGTAFDPNIGERLVQQLRLVGYYVTPYTWPEFLAAPLAWKKQINPSVQWR